MVRKSLIAIALLAVAAPLAAQEEYVWTSNRPDGHGPIGVMGTRTLDEGAIEFGYRFSQLNSRGVWFDNDSIPLDLTLEFYEVAPLSLTNQNHNFSIAVGATERLTFLASIDYSSRQHEQLTQDLIFYVTEAQELGDLRISGLYNFVNSGPYRAHFNIGALIPTGSDNVVGETPFSTPNTEALPYDMRPGGGTFAFLPGVTASIQNEFASVGFQLNSTRCPWARTARASR